MNFKKPTSQALVIALHKTDSLEHAGLNMQRGWVRSWNSKRSRKSAYDLLKVKRIKTFPVASDSVSDFVVYDPVKTRLSESLTEAEALTNQDASPQALQALRFCLQLRQSCFHWIVSYAVKSGIGNSCLRLRRVHFH